MLAYTTLVDIVQLPTALETVVYVGGLVFVLVCPYLFLNLMDRVSAANKPSQDPAADSKSDPQQGDL